uniref:Uncharacterized protein n=1 Tax=Helianthus annuus TaxID=4232 RepID=A0A251T1M2_HELAN
MLLERIHDMLCVTRLCDFVIILNVACYNPLGPYGWTRDHEKTHVGVSAHIPCTYIYTHITSRVLVLQNLAIKNTHTHQTLSLSLSIGTQGSRLSQVLKFLVIGSSLVHTL